MTDFRELVFRGVESDVLDYKAPMDWNLMSKAQKAKFVRHALAFANTRGGAIVVGVGEDAAGHPSHFQGLTEAQCHSFDPSGIGTFINSHVDPAIELAVERPEIDGKRYAILLIQQFKDIPHVCIHSVDEELRTGVFYIRTTSASSRPAARAGEMHDLIRRALRNQRELLGKLLRGILYESQTQNLAESGDHFPPEYDESVNYFARRLGKTLAPETPVWDFAVRPLATEATAVAWPLSELRRAAGEAVNSAAADVPDFLCAADIQASYATNVSLRGMSENRDKFWQLFQDGLLHFRCALGDGAIYTVLAALADASLEFAALFYSALGLTGETLCFRVGISHTENLRLAMPGESADAPDYRCRIPEIAIEEKISAATLLSARRDCSSHLLNEISVRFNAPILPRLVPDR